MSVVFLNITIKNNEKITSFKTKGILKEKSNILIYDDDEKTKNTLDLENNFLKRENKEYILYLMFEPQKVTMCRYNLKTINSFVDISLKTLDIFKTLDKYSVVYIIDDVDKFEYTVEILK